jgi:hypothetical protein
MRYCYELPRRIRRLVQHVLLRRVAPPGLRVLTSGSSSLAIPSFSLSLMKATPTYLPCQGGRRRCRQRGLLHHRLCQRRICPAPSRPFATPTCRSFPCHHCRNPGFRPTEGAASSPTDGGTSYPTGVATTRPTEGAANCRFPSSGANFGNNSHLHGPNRSHGEPTDPPTFGHAANCSNSNCSFGAQYPASCGTTRFREGEIGHEPP